MKKRLGGAILSGLAYIERYVGRWLQPSAGWVSVNPPSEVYDFLDVHLVNQNVGFAVGKRGIIFKTNDGGDSWSQLDSGTTNDLYGVRCIDANTVTVVGDAETILRTTDGGVTWIDPRTSPSSSGDVVLRDVFFADSLKGFVVGGRKIVRRLDDYTSYVPGLILRTNDGGATWERLNSQSGVIHRLNAVDFGDATTGTAVGGTTFFDPYHNVYASSTTIMRTTDGGGTWSELENNPYDTPGRYDKCINDVSFYDRDHGIAVGGFGVPPIYASDGVTWRMSLRDGCETYWLYSVCFLDASTAVAVGETGSAAGIYRSTDAGEVWSQVDYGTFPSLRGVSFGDSNTGVAVGRDSTVTKSNDGGQTWARSSSFQPAPVTEWEYVKDLHFVDANTGYAVGWFGNIIRSTNGGLTWERVGSVFNSLTSVFFTTAQRGVIGGSGFFRTIDGGASWSRFRSTDNGNTWRIQGDGTGYCHVEGIHFCDVNNGFIVGGYAQEGDPFGMMILRTTDGGATWSKVPLPGNVIQMRMTDVYCINPQKVIISGSNRLLRTTDGGATWTDTAFQYVQDLNAVHFVDENVGFAVGGVNALLRTDNGGDQWHKIDAYALGVRGRFYGVFFTDPNNGWVVGYHSTTSGGYRLWGVIYHTEDGGQSWTEQHARGGRLFDRQLLDVFFVDDNVGVIVGEKGTILRTTSGGT